MARGIATYPRDARDTPRLYRYAVGTAYSCCRAISDCMREYRSPRESSTAADPESGNARVSIYRAAPFPANFQRSTSDQVASASSKRSRKYLDTVAALIAARARGKISYRSREEYFDARVKLAEIEKTTREMYVYLVSSFPSFRSRSGYFQLNWSYRSLNASAIVRANPLHSERDGI